MEQKNNCLSLMDIETTDDIREVIEAAERWYLCDDTTVSWRMIHYISAPHSREHFLNRANQICSNKEFIELIEDINIDKFFKNMWIDLFVTNS